MGRSLLRRTFSLRNLLRAFLLLLTGLAGLMVAKAWWDSRVFSGYDPGLPLDAKTLSTGELGGFSTEKIEFTGLAGERIPMRLIRPQTAGKAPCIVFLYGIGQNTRFFDQIAPIIAARGFALAMPEQFQRGERRSPEVNILQKIFGLRERSSRIVPETRRAVDVLSQLPGIDPDRIHLMGASYGGITGCAVMVHEPRFRSVTFIMAGGDLPQLMKALARRYRPESPVLAPIVARLAAWMLEPFEPLDFVGKISPRPQLYLNVADDELIATDCLDALYDAADTPKTKRLYAGGHDSISQEVVVEMLNDSIRWLNDAAQN